MCLNGDDGPRAAARRARPSRAVPSARQEDLLAPGLLPPGREEKRTASAARVEPRQGGGLDCARKHLLRTVAP